MLRKLILKGMKIMIHSSTPVYMDGTRLSEVGGEKEERKIVGDLVRSHFHWSFG